jgi:hypothetical protein
VTVVLIFDPATSRLIGFRRLPAGRAVTQGQGDLGWADYIAGGSVRLETSRARADLTLNGADARDACSDLPRP